VRQNACHGLKYFGLLCSGLLRKPLRTVLTLLSIVVAFISFGLLHGVVAAADRAIEQFAANRLSVQSGEGRTTLPIAYLSKIIEVPHVARATALAYIPGYFGDPKNRIWAYAWSDARALDESGEVAIKKEYLETFARTRAGAIVDRGMATKYGWKVGDQISLKTQARKSDGSDVWSFDLVGIYDPPAHSLFTDEFWIHYQYLDEARVRGKGTVDVFIVYTTNQVYNTDVALAIDEAFGNSSYPTSTASEREWARTSMEQAIDFTLLVKAILGGSFFTLLFVTVNTMMESVRQRIPELGVLKALGFTDNAVLTLVFLEAASLYVCGATLGLAGSTLFFPFIAPVTTALEPMPMPLGVILEGAAIAVLAGFISGAGPAWRVRRLSVVDALRRG
jgi:putative ABC transport system permease protein